MYLIILCDKHCQRKQHLYVPAIFVTTFFILLASCEIIEGLANARHQAMLVKSEGLVLLSDAETASNCALRSSPFDLTCALH